LKFAFAGLNGGLFLMAIFTLLPVGFLQTWDSFVNGLWHARSPEFYNQPVVMFIGQWRIIPDLIIIAGAACLVAFVIQACLNLKPVEVEEEEEMDIPAAEISPVAAM
ncbi:MAG TPA: nitric-oxide reductase large subunit, partial [bacterium]|nr:nitric-oxide reductase large subunit [bacterium]